MQDRYAGDIGDYGKFGFLKALENTGLSIGINWYLTYPEEKESLVGDGKYRIPQKYYGCDPELADSLYGISAGSTERTVKTLEQASLLKTKMYYREPVQIKENRLGWHQKALNALKNADVIFLDPDNGLLVKSVSANSKKAVKFVFDKELLDYLERGQTGVFYQHRPRKKAGVYFEETAARIRGLCRDFQPRITVLTFPKYSVRDYFVISPDGRFDEQLLSAKEELLNGQWGKLGIVKQQWEEERL